MKILIIDDDTVILEAVRLLLESMHPFVILEARSGNQGIEIIKANPDIACVICDYNMPDGNGEDVYRYLLGLEHKIPYILCSTTSVKKFEIFKKHPPFGAIQKPEIFPAIYDQLLPLIKKPEFPEFVRIRMATILKHGLLSYDLYIKLNDEKYLKVMREGDVFENSDFSRFDAKNIEFLYVQSTEAPRVLKQMLQGLSQLSQTKNTNSLPDNIQISTTVLGVIADFNSTLGLTPEVEKLIHESVNFAVQTIRQNPKLSELYASLVVDPDSYLASHSVLLAHLSCGIASLLKWPSDTTFYKLSIASFLHDITLHSDALARIDSLEELDAKQNEITPEQKKVYLMHPKHAADLCLAMHELPPDVNIIIHQHHERPDGTGFPHKLSHHQISPLAAVFIVAEKMIAFRQSVGPDHHMSDFINSLPTSFQAGHFRNVINGITHSIVNTTLTE